MPSWQNNGKVIVADSPEEAVLQSDQWASEHLEVQTADWRYFLNHCKNYSSMFCGEETTVSYGDKTIGTNHVLHTMRNLRGQIRKAVTYQHATKEASLESAKVCERTCNYENMLAHGISCKVRVDK